jgi:glycosyltransferase involved in cell wall biosynthesis
MLYPTVSIIIPVRNEEKNIGECLEKIFNQNYPKDKIEIIIIDGMSEDRTREIIERFKLKVSKEELQVIRIIDNPKKQRASGLNIGIKESRGDVIMRVDARTIIPPDYIERCVRTLLKTGANNVGGAQKPIFQGLRFKFLDSNIEDQDRECTNSVKVRNRIPDMEHRILTQQAIGIALSHPFGVGDAQFRLGRRSGFVDTVYLGCFKKDVFNKVGLFDEKAPVISEDSDINYRIKKAGGKVYLNKDIVVYYYPRDNLKELWKLYFRYGGAKAGNFLKHKVLAWRQFVPPLFSLSLFLLPILGIFDKFFFYLWLLITGVYITTNFLVSFFLTLKYRTLNLKYSKLSFLWQLFFVFPTMHFSWALGFWRRLLQRIKPGEYWEY